MDSELIRSGITALFPAIFIIGPALIAILYAFLRDLIHDIKIIFKELHR